MKEYYSPLPAEVTIGNDKVTIEVKSYEHGVQELIQMAITLIRERIK